MDSVLVPGTCHCGFGIKDTGVCWCVERGWAWWDPTGEIRELVVAMVLPLPSAATWCALGPQATSVLRDR